MSVKKVVWRQYQSIVDRAAHPAAALQRPSEGWLRTVRKALGMSGAQLAEKMGVTRARVAQAEAAELIGGITLKSMQAAAEAMGCRFVYAIVPPQRIKDIVNAQARKKAAAIVATASKHMALENQALSSKKISEEVERLTREFAHEMPSDFWNEK
jgi:predicted DNA-binding mobile mystery protein A